MARYSNVFFLFSKFTLNYIDVFCLFIYLDTPIKNTWLIDLPSLHTALTLRDMLRRNAQLEGSK